VNAVSEHKKCGHPNNVLLLLLRHLEELTNWIVVKSLKRENNE
jgi:hypothetical protein